ncbi:Hem25p NDAI_0B03400 [Naumovozyma dairenensis CBS 421]|uniref:Mitochondrial glycine transporter n=1 Tax=Naumovozyma dairenensis (strain ATCC 10597 / BCRC 20456 / CBS 421 / NBRC 0211 / NRRL Y-12639) TaxID=1071378 RepID=G0W6G3_NAUDC|nr:hypothetical protein NDAI_0B03400 [Naumovozyma dairenensis CBS 421]CCD23374.1 hypothetical protein NDAI_0B03400 [Naumovozyma dairenensis CBS 421]
MTESSSSKTTVHLVGGFLGGLSSAVTLQPLDLLKTRIQQHKGSTLLTALKEIKNPLQFWRGTLPSALRTSIGSGLYLSCLNIMRTTLVKERSTLLPSSTSTSPSSIGSFGKSSKLPQLTMSENLITGALARGLVGCITMPITVLKVRYESTFYHYKSLNEAIINIYTTEGTKGFFRGVGATCLRDAPYAGLYVLLYEKSKQIVPKFLPTALIHYDKNGKYNMSTSTLVNSTSAFISASLATTATAPLDTIKTRMQLDPKVFNGFFKTVYIIVRKESVLNLFSGLSMRLTRKALSAGIAWGIYEDLIKRFM